MLICKLWLHEPIVADISPQHSRAMVARDREEKFSARKGTLKEKQMMGTRAATRAAVLLAAVGLGFGTATVLAQESPPQAAPTGGGCPCAGGDGPGGMSMGRGPGGHGCPGGPGMMLFEWFDDDDDGKVTLQEFREGEQERFVEMDTNHDGKVTIEEFKAAPMPSREARLQRMFKRLDTNNDGVLTAEELAARGEAKFKKLDANGDGVITMEEIRQAMPNRGPGCPQQPAGKK